MMKTENSRPGVGAPERETGLKTEEAFCPNDTPPRPKMQGIAALLCRGEENAVPLRYLASITGQSTRAVRLRIKAERDNGVPICSNNRTGYYLPATREEMERFVRSMIGRSNEIRESALAVREAWPG